MSFSLGHCRQGFPFHFFLSITQYEYLPYEFYVTIEPIILHRTIYDDLK